MNDVVKTPSAESGPAAGDRGAGGGELLIELSEVDKAFGNNVVYQGMNLQVFEGETLTIIGGSGLGKSVCLKLMIGLLTQDEGRVTYRGTEVADMSAEQLRQLRQEVSMVFQGGALFDSMSVLENVGYALVEHTSMGDEEIRERALECLEMVGLGQSDHPDILEKFPANLSGGMRKRVALARSIAIRPAVILYDEPTTGLDPPNCDRIAMMIRDLQKRLNVTSIVVTHDIDTAFYVSDRMAMLHDKHFPWVAPTEEFKLIEDDEVQDFIIRRTR